MATDISQLGPWHNISVDRVRQGFVAHIKRSAFPEDFVGVAIDVQPPKDRGFTIIHKDVTVVPAKRQRLSINPDNPLDCRLPCNLCGSAPKFQNCGYAILCEYGYVYFVGSICAAKHYEGKFADAQRSFDRDERERRAQEYFYQNAARIPLISEHARKLRDIAKAYATAHKAIKRLPTFRKAIRRAIIDNGGWLTIASVEHVQMPDGTSYPQESIKKFAKVTGETAVRGEYSLVEQLESHTEFLDEFGLTTDDALNGIIRTQESGKLPELHDAVLRATQVVNMAHDDLVKFRLFFQQNNLENVRRWLRQRDCKIKCHAENADHIWWFRVHSSDRRRPIDTSIFEAPIPPRPYS